MSDPGIIVDGAIAIDKKRIVAVGTTRELRSRFQPGTVFDAAGRSVCPGFVDCHTHVVYAGDRIDEFEQKLGGADYLDILAAGGGINSTVRAVREADYEELVAESRPRLNAMFLLGTTTAEVKTGYGLDTDNELKMLDAIAALDRQGPVRLVSTFLGAHAVPPEFAGRTEDYVHSIIAEQIPAAASDATFIDVFCEKNAFSVEQARRILEAGMARGLRVKMHLDEFTNLGGVALALSLNAVSIDHLEVTTPAELQQIATTPTVCVVMPAVNFHLGSRRFADARAILDAGAILALATDINPGSAPCPSMPLVMALACRWQKLRPAEALHAATINAAAAIGLEHEIGSIEVGKRADLLVLKSSDYRSLMYEFGGNPVHEVFSHG